MTRYDSEGLRRSQHVIMQVLSAQELEAAAERASGEWRTAEARLFYHRVPILQRFESRENGMSFCCGRLGAYACGTSPGLAGEICSPRWLHWPWQNLTRSMQPSHGVL